MTKQIVLTNGDLTVGLDPQGQVQSLYYPDTSRGNHVGSHTQHHRIGVYCEGAVHWLDDGAWQIRQDYYPGRLISRTVADNHWLDLRLEMQNYVDSDLNVLVRNIHVVNLSNRSRQIKLFLHQAFVINDNPREVDTAKYLPAGAIRGVERPVISHYYDDTTLLVTGDCCETQHGFSEYSIGHFGQYGDSYYNGVWCDAADGVLAGNPIEEGSTDSIIGFLVHLAPHDSAYVNYYLSAGNDLPTAGRHLQKFLHEGIDSRTKQTAEHWLMWLQPAFDLIKTQVEPDYRYDVIDAIVASRSCLSNDGALCATDSQMNLPIVQPAVAAQAASLLMRLQLEPDAARIFDFLTGLLRHSPYLQPAYLTSGNVASNHYPWPTDSDNLPISITDNATVLISLCRSIMMVHTGRSLPAEWKRRWQKLGQPIADFLSDYIDPITKLPRPSFHADSESPITTTLDTAVVYGALNAAARVADLLKDVDNVIKYHTASEDIREHADSLWNDSANYFYHGLVRQNEVVSYDSSLHSSDLLGATLFGLFSDDLLAVASQTLIDQHLDNNGTFMRHASDDVHDATSLTQITTLSLLLNRALGRQYHGLLATCQTVLQRGGYGSAVSDYPSISQLQLELTFVSCCLDQLSNPSGGDQS